MMNEVRSSEWLGLVPEHAALTDAELLALARAQMPTLGLELDLDADVPSVRAGLLRMMRAAVAAERERCAKKPLTAQQLDKLIEAHVGGSELADAEYSAMVMFAASVERAHGIGA